MALNTTKYPRVFKHKNQTLTDPNPQLSPEEVMAYYSNQYPLTGKKSMSNRSKDNLRSSVIDELITADNWFTIVRDEEKVKLFSCTTPQILKSSIVTLMLQEEQYASLFVDAFGEYVKRQKSIDLLRISKN